MMKKYMNWLIGVLCCAVVSGIYYYVELPAMNIHSGAFWMFWVIALLSFSIPFGVLSALKGMVDKVRHRGGAWRIGTTAKVLLILACVPFVVMIIGALTSSTLFNAKRYASVIEVETAVFEEDMPEATTVTNIALMDSSSAQIIGNRTLGSLSSVISQYEAGYTYNQINYHGTPQKVTCLEYVDFFKWFNNRKNGIPGYIMVDPVNNSANYVALDQPIRYVSSAYFNDKLERRLRFAYPTKIFGSYSFEINEQGEPYYVVSCLTARVGLFGAMDVNEVIVFNPSDGSSELYPVSDTPSWVDEVYSGNLATQKYDWYGMYSGGYWNSVIGNKDCKKTTNDFGYITIGDDVWYFTGVTSIVSDESNIGFIISNARTGEYKFYPVVGAEEYSAMSAAEGEVQEKGYRASFPSLINISGKATYIMVLKDDGGLVKLYALVNVENYGIVATGQTQSEAMNAYKKLLVQNGLTEGGTQTESETDVEVEDIRIITADGSSVIYITASDRTLYKARIADDETLLMIRPDDHIRIGYSETGTDGIRSIDNWSFITPDDTEENGNSEKTNENGTDSAAVTDHSET